MGSSERVVPQTDWKDVWQKAKPIQDWLRSGPESEGAGLEIQALREGFLVDEAVAQALQQLPRKVHVAGFAETWCHDSRRTVAVLEALAESSRGNLLPRYMSKREQPQVFAGFLTNGAESLPKLVFLTSDFVETGNWGPIPQDCKDLIARGKACGDIPSARRQVEALLAADPQHHNMLSEILTLIRRAAATSL